MKEFRRRRSTMSKENKEALKRRALIVGFFSAEFIAAFAAIASGSMAVYGVLAVGGCVLPILAGAK